MNEIFHQGEKEIQKRVGEQAVADRNGRAISNTITRGAFNFIEKQPMAVVSSADNKGQVWVSLLVGDFGFVTVPNAKALTIHKSRIYSDANDIFFQNLESNVNVGSLFIELDTRRRFRINGVASLHGDKIDVTVEEAYPNCPKYIQQRVISSRENFGQVKVEKAKETSLTHDHINWIKASDTLFVGSQSNNSRFDASHRGGNPGFVDVLDEKTLKIPDYKGNGMYNTLGNFVQNPNAGLLFIDFQNQRTLQLTGTAEIMFDPTGEQDLVKTTGTGRYWLFRVKESIVTTNHHHVNWELMSYSPFNPKS
ncbi:pyridoxamine 5'-phosphate oxidase family protein [Fulvivirga sp. 29W222]|uniref:Pyridoxamine 5'-phosphate oxidase family protein n=1 Tax=Fulvivirga marina TaxID=2494733 RepID=A0A937KAU1_9BACT|nr:pyridoxamine 5'-phosphate oxidase family protein [Fulvivirga marina]MBL6445996.1 pyridoxamine 5'-phosphate oxidase family protein [Fulvivirga marina]